MTPLKPRCSATSRSNSLSERLSSTGTTHPLCCGDPQSLHIGHVRRSSMPPAPLIQNSRTTILDHRRQPMSGEGEIGLRRSRQLRNPVITARSWPRPWAHFEPGIASRRSFVPAEPADDGASQRGQTRSKETSHPPAKRRVHEGTELAERSLHLKCYPHPHRVRS